MSLFQWFVRKSATRAAGAPPSPDAAHANAAVSFHAGSTSRRTHTSASHAVQRKTERLERRKLLYAVVRDAMTRAGVLSARYTFKVLSLDSRGGQYLIMVDLTRGDAGPAERLAEIEGLIAQNAKIRHDLRVTSVYWRMHDQATSGLSKSAASQPPLSAGTPPAAHLKPRYDPVCADEMSAFKHAMTKAAGPVTLSAPGEIVTTDRRNPASEQSAGIDIDIDAEVDRRASPLSGTQYGDLN